MTRKMLSFLLGAALASAWWQAAVFEYGNHSQWAPAIIVTVISIIIIAFNCVIHINDKF